MLYNYVDSMTKPEEVVQVMKSIVETYYLSIQTNIKLRPSNTIESVSVLSTQIQQDLIDAVRMLQSLDLMIK